jgi:hypothetical protein
VKSAARVGNAVEADMTAYLIAEHKITGIAKFQEYDHWDRRVLLAGVELR